jgi:hypothetical protein
MARKAAEGSYELTPAQASWIDKHREEVLDDPELRVLRDGFCDGCILFGLCVFHAEGGKVRSQK